MALSLGQTDIANWDPASKHIYETEFDVNDKNLISSDDVAVLSGGVRAKRFADLSEGASIQAAGSSSNLRFIGLATQLTINSARSVTPIYELGSSLAYWLGAQVTSAGSISVVTFKGPTLISRIFWDIDKNSENADKAGFWLKKDGNQFAPDESGVEGFFGINLDAEVLQQPVGLAVLFRFRQGQIAGWYLENCYIQSGAFSINSGANIMGETTPIYIDRIVPFYVTFSS